MSTNVQVKPNDTILPVKGSFVLPDQVEEEAKIISIKYYQSTYPRIILFCFLTLITGGIYLLLCKWKNTLAIQTACIRCRPDEAGYLLIFGADGTIEPVIMTKKNLCLTGEVKNYKCFVYRLYTYSYDTTDCLYKPVQFEIKNKTYEAVLNEFAPGITSAQLYNERAMTYGKNSTDIEQKSNIEVAIDELSSPFYIFQVFAIVFWAKWNDYFVYAMIILGISCFTFVYAFISTKISLKRLYERAHYEIPVTVMRSDGGKLEKKVVSSTTLVPGDLIEIPCNKKMPCDVILLNGTCVMNESMLTGESIPIIKQRIPKTERIFDAKNADQYLLYSGTECLETRSGSKDTVVGFVLRTGFDTMKGRLVRSFIYSKPENFKFYRDSIKYLGAMAVVAVICFGVSCKFYKDQGVPFGDYVVAFLEIITCAVPPALPTCLAVGTAMASARLEKKKIITKTEPKINVAGRVKVMCFDKTGTLTQDSLDLFGVRIAAKKEGAIKFENLISENINSSLNSTAEKSHNETMLELMATCHALTYVRGAVSGDPLDLRMFEATKWSLKEHDEHDAQFGSESRMPLKGNEGQSAAESSLCTVSPPLEGNTANGYHKSGTHTGIVKRFDFVADLQRMSVIVKDPNESKQRVYVKGSPEVISTLCRPESLPQDLHKALLIYTQSGLRVIACATRTIDETVNPDSQIERATYENNLEFLGLLVFENKLKEVTHSIITKLKDADIATLMLTGDNPLTAIFVARDCGIVESNCKVILGAMVSLDSNPKAKRIVWKYIEQTMVHQQEAVSNAVTDDKASGEVPQSKLEEILKQDKTLTIALTGEATNYVADTADISDSLRKIIFKKGKVFARMKPDDKAFIVDQLQVQGNIVGMCGDGANDCPALKIANVGIALSEAEASLAAPFMSRITDISSVDIILREGRCALVTSFQCFKFMSLYALIQTFNIAILNSRVSAMTNGTFLYEDLYIVLPLCLTMGMTGPTEKLTKKRPTENLLSATVLVGMFGQCIIQVVGQIIGAVIVNRMSWYKNPTELFDEEYPDGGDDDSSVTDWDLTVVFLVAAFQFFSTVMTFSIGKPFRKPFYTNWLFTLSLIFTTASTLVLILIPIDELNDLMGMRDFTGHQSFRWIIFAIVLVNGLITVLYERLFVPFIIKAFRKIFRIKKNKKEL